MASSRAQVPPLKTLFRTLYRWKRPAILSFVAVMGAAVAFAIFWPRAYQSEAKVYVRKGRETVTLDPTATMGETTNLVDSRDREINSVVSLMQSRFLAEKVVNELGADLILNGPSESSAEEPSEPSQPNVVNQLIGWAASIDPVSAKDKAIQQIQKMLAIEAHRNSNVISLRYLDTTPENAQRVLSAVLAAYESEHLRINQTQGSKDFFEKQSLLLHEQWQAAAEKLRSLKDEGGFASIDTHRSLLESRLSRIEDRLIDAQTKLTATLTKVEMLQSMVNSMSENKISETEEGHPNQARDGMRQQLYALELKERELSATYGDSHPKLVMVRAQLADAKKIVKEQQSNTVRTKTSLNEEREILHLSLMQELAESESLISQVASHKKQLAKLNEQLVNLNRLELEVFDAQQEVDLAATSYRTYAESLEQTRVNEALETNRISNVNTYQPASLESKPYSPRKGLVAAAGMVLAIVASLLAVAVCEHLDTTMRTPEEVEDELDLPVLVKVPTLSREHQLL